MPSIRCTVFSRAQNTELRRQVYELNTTLANRNQALVDAKTALGTDKGERVADSIEPLLAR